jgi:enamine deaminase RidA (YjgF/YER057c/UK114 family)
MLPIERHEPYAGMLHCAVTHGDTIYLAGIVADDSSGDMHAQATNVLEQLDEMLATFGLDRSRVLSATIFITDMAQKADMNRAWKAFFDERHLPARATIGVADLGPGVLIEVVGIVGR